jgi:regulator of replication initiation timing
MSGTAPVAPAAAAPKAAETLASKVQKHVDSLHAKIQKLLEENAALKAQLHEARSSNSRIRRIPKKPSAAPAEA